MRKTAAAVTVGIILIAGQAAATSSTVGARVSDRIGGQDGVVEQGLEGKPCLRAPDNAGKGSVP